MDRPPHDATARAFAALNISPDRVIGEAVGLRPFRRSGFVARAEPFGAKTLVHNYGHGGCGVSLAWGTAELALEAARGAGGAGPVAVLGAGVVGLAAAVRLADAGFAVTVYADALPPDTTSNVAAAIWGPTTLYEEGAVEAAFLERFARAARSSHARWRRMAAEGRPGVRVLRKLMIDVDAPMMAGVVGADLYPNLRAEPGIAARLGAAEAISFDAIMIDPDLCLPALMEELTTRRGRLVRRRFETVDDVAALEEPLVINCTGLGSKALFGDEELTPIRGQLVLLEPQPEIDFCYAWPRADGLYYMYPRAASIVLGGTMEQGSSSLAPDPKTRERLLAAHAEIAERLAG
jgi:glycine/D-amino acid oxidase-like deaminating enzyme